MSTSMTLFQPSTPMAYQEWADAGQIIWGRMRALPWLWASWLLYGQNCFPSVYSQALPDPTHPVAERELGTLKHYVWVAERVPETVDGQPHRDYENLSFNHHACVAALPVEEQKHWLNVAREEGLSVHALRERRSPPKKGSKKDRVRTAMLHSEARRGEVWSEDDHTILLELLDPPR